MCSVFRFWVALTLGLALMTACGGNDAEGGSGGSAGTGGTGGCTTEVPVPWLAEGNFWKVAWTYFDVRATTLSGVSGGFDVGSYNIKLGPPREVGENTMHPLQLSGDLRKLAPLWDAIGTDGCGAVMASSGDAAPVAIYRLSGTTPANRGFWTDFSGALPVSVDRNASMIPSQYTNNIEYFEPPLSSIGSGASESGIGAGTGCEYFPGYGTICGSDDPGATETQYHYEYWDEAAGPIGYHKAYTYIEGGALAEERRHEERVEVWAFGDTSELPIQYEDEPDSYAKPTPLQVATLPDFSFMVGEVNNFDDPSGIISGYEPLPDHAADVHDWFSFEITPDLEGRTLELYLVWDDDVDFRFFLYTAPENPTYGFQLLDEASATDAFSEDFNHAKWFGGTFVPGEYLVGVLRASQSEFANGYGIIVVL